MITVEIKEDEITAVLNRLQRALTDLSEPMQEIGEILINSTKQRFKDGESPDGTAWAPKSPATIEAYKRRGDRVDLRPLFGPSKRLSNEIFYEVRPDGVEYGSNLIQAAVMQFGATKGAFGKAANDTPIPWGAIPARPYLGISDEDRTNIIETVEEWLGRVAQGSD